MALPVTRAVCGRRKESQINSRNIKALFPSLRDVRGNQGSVQSLSSQSNARESAKNQSGILWFRSYEKKTGGMAEMIQCKPQVLLTDDTRVIIREWGAQQGGQQAQPAPYVAPPTQQPAPPPVQQPAPEPPQQTPAEPFSSSFEQLFD